MRIAFVTNEFVTERRFSGGLGNYLHRVTHALSESGCQVTVFTSSLAGNETFQHGRVSVERVLPVWDRRQILDHLDPLAPRSLYQPYQDVKAAWCLWRRWTRVNRRQHFDVVQVANVGAVGFWFRFERRVPVITRMSSYRPAWDHAAGMPITRAARARWKLEKYAAEKSFAVYAPTRFVARQVEENYRVGPVSVVETPFHLADVDEDCSAIERHCGKSPYLLFFGRMSTMKGTHVLGAALPKVLSAMSDLQAIFVGADGRSPDGGSMQQFILQCLPGGLQSRVRFVAPLRHDELYPIVRGARVVALPSLIDNMPNTCLEAMGLGQLVVATTGSCFEDLIEDGRSGFLVPPGDVDSLGQAILRMLRLSETERESMTTAARQRIAQLAPEVMVPKIVQYFETVCVEFAERGRFRRPGVMRKAADLHAVGR